ncbi:hypothetical protein CYMTET_6209 [Cymbomonas tetramitiformis]|uniref:N-acetyltransferase domain-containing protein n=1 Tax=Cymbomonas tetramitiformis TaxID=36881 RepID=A0AAE0GXK7_9CHLO|nr:hypothetical protein CYMTET_6209 [Cymbomonas tetramitiformis]
MSQRTIAIVEAKPQNFFEVADVHCQAFHPKAPWPLNKLLRADRMLALAFPITESDKSTRQMNLVAVESVGTFPLIFERIVGSVTIATVCEEKGTYVEKRRRRESPPPANQRLGIAYVSNVAVKSEFRRQGVARQLMAEAERKAREDWRCKTAALHCDGQNEAALGLYTGLGYTRLSCEPAWIPYVRLRPAVRLTLLMKRLRD